MKTLKLAFVAALALALALSATAASADGIKGNGGNVRYVTLPYEAHGYAARESIEHVLYEMIRWFDLHVKRALPEPG